MFKQYIKQTVALIKQHPLFSALYILGTALAIAATMLLANIYYIKSAPIYPEHNRNNTSYITLVSFKTNSGGQTIWAFSYKAVKEFFYPLQNLETVSAAYRRYSEGSDFVTSDRVTGEVEVLPQAVDPAFFNLYSFRFTEGASFTQSDFESGIHAAVITDELARKLFNQDSGVVGQTFQLNFIDYKVVGVVKSASFLTPQSYANLYVPYTTFKDYDKERDIPYLGAFRITIVTKGPEQLQELRNELAELTRKINVQHEDEYVMSMWEQPTTHLSSVFQNYPSRPADIFVVLRQLLYMLLALLLVPALNLSGLISNRMDERLGEMGVRKSFGASRGVLLKQIMYENLILTLMGGFLGLIFSWLLLYFLRSSIFSLFDAGVEKMPIGYDYTISGDMLFAPLVFAATLVFCVLLNLLSALIPAWQSLRKPIVNSLNDKR